MPILVECECGKTLQVPDQAAGKKVRCKACSATIPVPAADSQTYDVDDEFDEPQPLPGKTRAGRLPGVVNKKTKKKKQQPAAAKTPQSGPKWLMPVVIVVGLAIGFTGGFFGVRALLSAAGGGKGAAKGVPDKFLTHTVENGNFKFDYPEGWEVFSGGGTGGVPPWGTFARQDISFDMRGDSKGAPLADIASLNKGEELPPELSPVARMHQTQYEIKYKYVFDNLQEQPGGFYDVKFGQGWLAEFTATEGLFGSKIHGYRLTLLGGVHQFNVICKCSEKNWEAYKPMFQRVMKSIDR